MADPETHQPHTAHTVGPVPFVMVGAPAWVDSLENGRLADVAPTVLDLLDLQQPPDMTGRSLAIRISQRTRAAAQ